MTLTRRACVWGGIASVGLWGVGSTTHVLASPEANDASGASHRWQHLRPFLGNPRLVGQDTYTYWGFDVYHASLWAGPQALPPEQWQSHRLALELRYLRQFSGKDIAQRSIDEMQAQSPLPPSQAQAWLQQLQGIFPNVRKGDRLTGVYLPDKGATFLLDQAPLGGIQDLELAQRFFAIWLSPKTSAPALRQKLLANASA
ncbi:MAG: hypothetical protein EB125_08480 [Betaproteobacteria bacterium]|nr:hypothetical protein [Betaproteobacteria bacterium]